jgi:hypothetical protein
MQNIKVIKPMSASEESIFVVGNQLERQRAQSVKPMVHGHRSETMRPWATQFSLAQQHVGV